MMITEAEIEIKAKEHVQKHQALDATTHELLHRECGFIAGYTEAATERDQLIEYQQRYIAILRKALVELCQLRQL